MAFTSITARGSNVSTANDTTVAVSPSATLTVGKLVVVCVASKNVGTADGATTTHTVTDTNSNTWTRQAEYTETAGVASDGSTISVHTAVIATQIGTGDTITCTLSGAVAEKIITVFEATITNRTVSLAQVGVGQNAISASVTGLTSREYLLVGAAAAEGSDNFKTPDADYTEQFDLRSRNASTATTIHVQTRVATLTSDTCTSTGWTNTDPIALLVALYEILTPSLPPVPVIRPLFFRKRRY